LPFYAGWGLTEDRIRCARRAKKLTLDELVFGALITYPRYFNVDKKIFVEPEDAIDPLAAMAAKGAQTRTWYRKVLRLLIMVWAKMRREDRP
jgi:capsular polysaccharide export protein